MHLEWCCSRAEVKIYRGGVGGLSGAKFPGMKNHLGLVYHSPAGVNFSSDLKVLTPFTLIVKILGQPVGPVLS